MKIEIKGNIVLLYRTLEYCDRLRYGYNGKINVRYNMLLKQWEN